MQRIFKGKTYFHSVFDLLTSTQMESARTVLESYFFQVIKSSRKYNKTFYKSSKLDKFLHLLTKKSMMWITFDFSHFQRFCLA